MQPESRQSSRRALIAIIIVVVILIVIAVLLAPRYLQDRQANQQHAAAIRAQVAQGLQRTDPARIAFTVYLARMRIAPPDNTAAGLSFADELGGTFVKSVRIGDGKIIVTYGNKADAAIDNRQLQLVPHTDVDGVVRWKCSSIDIDEDYLPPDCR